MDPSVVGGVIAAALAGIGLGAAALLAPVFSRLQRVVMKPYEDRLDAILRRGLRPKSSSPVSDKLDRVASLSRELADLNADISSELRRSIEETSRLKSEAETAKELASLSEGQAKAVVSVMNQGEGRNRAFQIVVAFIFFVAGVLAGAFVPGWIRALFPDAAI